MRSLKRLAGGKPFPSDIIKRPQSKKLIAAGRPYAAVRWPHIRFQSFASLHFCRFAFQNMYLSAKPFRFRRVSYSAKTNNLAITVPFCQFVCGQIYRKKIHISSFLFQGRMNVTVQCYIDVGMSQNLTEAF